MLWEDTTTGQPELCAETDGCRIELTHKSRHNLVWFTPPCSEDGLHVVQDPGRIRAISDTAEAPQTQQGVRSRSEGATEGAGTETRCVVEMPAVVYAAPMDAPTVPPPQQQEIQAEAVGFWTDDRVDHFFGMIAVVLKDFGYHQLFEEDEPNVRTYLVGSMELPATISPQPMEGVWDSLHAVGR
jgi:hypothetical protein